jgi:hypothetical protein
MILLNVHSINQSSSLEITKIERLWDGGSILIDMRSDNESCESLIFKRAQGGRKLTDIILIPKDNVKNNKKDNIIVISNSLMDEKIKVLFNKYINENPNSKYTLGAIIALSFLNNRNRTWDDNEWITAINN